MIHIKLSVLTCLRMYASTHEHNAYIPYKWIYWRVEYLVICLKNSVSVILIWRNGR